MRAQVYEIRADIAATLLREGEFRAPIRGLTVYIRERQGREVLGLLVHDNRDPAHPVTYLAARGALLRGSSGPVLLMREGTIQRLDHQEGRPGRLAVLRFSRYSYDLSPFLPEAGPHKKKSAERSLAELFHPEAAVDADDRREFRAEGHGRLAAPLYAPVFGLIAAAALLSGPLGRPAGAGLIALATASALGLRLLGLIIVHLSASLPALIPLIHAVPLMAIATCLVLLGEGRHRRRAPALPGLTA
jgi:lipopolysaccharide export system permease protein